MSSSALSTLSSSRLYTTEQVRALDSEAIDNHGISARILMKRAGRAAFTQLTQLWPNTDSVHVCCGAGNNGGDGYVVAALAAQRQLSVTVWTLAPSSGLKGAACDAFEFARQAQVRVQPFNQEQFAQALAASKVPVVVDALLGTGAAGAVRETYAEAIEAINASGAPVLSLDIPSGVNGDTGAVESVAIEADATVSFVGQKIGLFSGVGRAFSGVRYFDDLGVPSVVFSTQEPVAELLHVSDIGALLAPRNANAHKGDHGYVLVVGGDYCFGGAPIMAAEMALRAGAGLVGVATRDRHVSAINTRCPEAMAQAVDSGQALLPLLSRATALVVGPGLGTAAWGEQLFYQALMSPLPLVVDADGLNLLTEKRFADVFAQSNHAARILTPHPGEAARLLGVSPQHVQTDRIAAARALQSRFGGVVVLKGPGTVVADSTGCISVCDHGNPGMASGGMGDVLSGLLGALLAQGLSADDSARAGVALHSAAADHAAEFSGEKGLLATDLIPYVRELIND